MVNTSVSLGLCFYPPLYYSPSVTPFILNKELCSSDRALLTSLLATHFYTINSLSVSFVLIPSDFTVPAQILSWDSGIEKHVFTVWKIKLVLAIIEFEMSRHLVEMGRCSEEMDFAIEKLQQNFQELRNNLEKAFLEQGRALLRFESQWKDLKSGHTRDLEQRDQQLQQMGISVPSTWRQQFPTANPNPTLHSNSSTVTATLRWSETNTPLPLPPRDSTTKFFCDICKIFCDTKMVLDKHKMGKKHQMNLGKMKGKTVTGQGQTSKKKAVSPPEEDLQTKKRRVIEGGVSPHSLRTCTICNVVSISPTDFYKHLSGQRHREAAALMNIAAGSSSCGQLRIRD